MNHKLGSIINSLNELLASKKLNTLQNQISLLETLPININMPFQIMSH